MKHIRCLLIVFFAAAYPLFGADMPSVAGTAASGNRRPEIIRLFSFDMSFMNIGLRNNGWGLGVKYEQRVFPHCSLTGGFAHTTLQTDVDDVYCTTVGISLLANYYPFSADLRYLHIGAGIGTDFLNYFGSDIPDDAAKCTLISFITRIGFRMPLKFSNGSYRYLNRWFIGVFAGWKHFFMTGNTYGNPQHYIDSGLQYGISIKKYF